MGWRDKLKAGAEEVKTGAGEATARARETMHDAQVRRELQNAYTDLGRRRTRWSTKGRSKTSDSTTRWRGFASWDRSWSTLSRRRNRAVLPPAGTPTRAR